jgi:hypothetical protein
MVASSQYKYMRGGFSRINQSLNVCSIFSLSGYASKCPLTFLRPRVDRLKNEQSSVQVSDQPPAVAVMRTDYLYVVASSPGLLHAANSSPITPDSPTASESMPTTTFDPRPTCALKME